MFFSWTAGTVQHGTSPHKPFSSLFISTVVAIHCQKFKLTLTVTAQMTFVLSRKHGSLYASEVLSHLLPSKHSSTKGHAVRNPPLTSTFILLKYTHRF